jgi:hypothetical protein
MADDKKPPLKKGPLKQGLFEFREVDSKVIQDFRNGKPGVVKISVPTNIPGSRVLIEVTLKFFSPGMYVDPEGARAGFETMRKKHEKNNIQNPCDILLIEKAQMEMQKVLSKQTIGIVGEVGKEKKEILLLYLPDIVYAYSIKD